MPINPASGGSFEKHLIYIVEDNIMYARTLCEYLKVSLKESGAMETVEILMFTAAEKCEEALKTNPLPPDFIIIDHFLDSMNEGSKDGATFVRETKQKYPGIKFIMLSSQDDARLAVKLIKTNHCDYVVKTNKAFEVVQKIISGHVMNEL